MLAQDTPDVGAVAAVVEVRTAQRVTSRKRT